jgi:hypothetical protein
VQQVQVQAVGVQPPDAVLAGPGRALAGRVVRQHLADQEDLVAAAGDGPGDQFLRLAVAVHLGRVDQVHAQIQAAAQRGDLRVPAARDLAQVPGALAEHRNLVARWQGDGRHRTGHESSRARRMVIIGEPRPRPHRQAA